MYRFIRSSALLIIFINFNTVSANPLQGFTGANLKETASFTFFGNVDLGLSKKDQQSSLSGKRNELGFETTLALYKTENSKIYFMGDSKQTDLGQDFLIGENQVKVKGKLIDSEAGFGFAQKNNDGTRYSISGKFGSASDKFWSAKRDTALEATGSYALIPTEKGQLILLLHYSNNRSFLNNIPLPLLAYVYRYSKSFVISAGLPFLAFSWFDIPEYTLNLFATPGAYGIDGSKYIIETLQIFSSFNFRAKSFMHSERLENHDRLILEDKKLTLGLKSTPAKYITLSLAGGFSFDRFIYEGKSIFKVKGDQLRQENDAFLQSRISFAY